MEDITDADYAHAKKVCKEFEILIKLNKNDKTEYVLHIGNLKQALSHRLVFKKVNIVIEFNENAWLKPYIEHRYKKKRKNMILKKIFLS